MPVSLPPSCTLYKTGVAKRPKHDGTGPPGEKKEGGGSQRRIKGDFNEAEER